MSLATRIFYLFLFVLTTSTITVAQSHPILGSFSATEIQGKVYISWKVVAGSTCDGIQIFRSNDSSVFSQIGNIPGVCGNTSFEQTYSFIDNNPFKNSINYYRLELGNQGSSQTISVEIIDFTSNSYQIRPHPVNTETNIYFNNINKQEMNFSLFSLNNIEMLTLTTREDFFQLNTSLLQSGLYFFTISVAEKNAIIQGKLLVQH